MLNAKRFAFNPRVFTYWRADCLTLHTIASESAVTSGHNPQHTLCLLVFTWVPAARSLSCHPNMMLLMTQCQ